MSHFGYGQLRNHRPGPGPGDAAALAQLVEHIIRNDGVTGSNPVSGTTTSTKKIRNIRRKGLPQMTVNLSFWRHFQLEIASDPRWAQLDDE